MKKKLNLWAVLFGLFLCVGNMSLVSCSDDDDEDVPGDDVAISEANLVGTWKWTAAKIWDIEDGYWDVTNGHIDGYDGEINLFYTFNADGTFNVVCDNDRFFEGGPVNGTWSLEGNKIILTNIEESAIATIKKLTSAALVLEIEIYEEDICVQRSQMSFKKVN